MGPDGEVSGSICARTPLPTRPVAPVSMRWVIVVDSRRFGSWKWNMEFDLRARSSLNKGQEFAVLSPKENESRRNVQKPRT